jgi:hypothetical protein
LRDGEFVSSSAANVVSFNVNDIAPPSMLYVQRDDQLILQCMNGSQSQTFTVTVRLLLAEGSISAIQRILRPGSIFSVSQLAIPLAEGYLLSVAVACDSASTRGIAFASAFIARGGSTAAFATLGLLCDYVTVRAVASWPGGRQIHPTEGPGNIRLISVAQPATGAEWTLTVQNGARWRVMAIESKLVTAVAVANRISKVQYFDGISGLSFYTAVPDQAVAAATTAQICAAPGANTTIPELATVNQALPIDLVLSGLNPTTINSLTTGLQAGDQYSSVSVLVEEWLDY